MRNPNIRKALASALTVSLALALGACGGMPSNRSLESVHQPVVSATNFTLDVSAGPGGISVPEQRRLAGWFDAMDPGLDPDAEDEDGSALVFDAISGAAVNGLLPNGDYDASIIRLGAENLTKPPRQNFFAPSKNSSDSYCDETGYTFKINLTPINNPAFKPQGKFPSRNALEIHPTYHKNTDGCTGLTGTHSEIVRFWNYYNKIKTRQPKIILRVEIDNNNNLGIQKYKE